MEYILLMVCGMIGGIVLSMLWSQYRYNQMYDLLQSKIKDLTKKHQTDMDNLIMQHQLEIGKAQKRSVNTSRAVLKGKMAEQFAPFSADFHYLPSDARFIGDPIDYVIFSGYSEFREGILEEEDIEIVLIDIKSGQSQLSSGQKAIRNAIRDGRVRFEMVRYDFDD